MATLQIHDLSLAFGDRDILDGVSFILTDRSRAALCGANGSGKSTLLKALSGLIAADHMEKSETKGLTTAYLPQSEIVLSGESVLGEVEKGYGRFASLVREKEEIESILAEGCEDDRRTENSLTRLHEIEEVLEEGGYYSRKTKMGQVLTGLGFLREDFNRPCSEFSGGWQMRIALARILVENATIMLLDEPTNYLDIEALTWLKSFLSSYKGGLMIVSHDQGFLDDTVSEVYELFRGKLTRYSGNYSRYQKQREEEIKSLEAESRAQREVREKNEVFIERFRFKATKSRQVQSRIKQMEKLRTIEIPGHLKKLSFSFPPAPHSGSDVLSVDHLAKRYGSEHIFDDFSFMVNRGDRLAVTGRNGAGKSTLLRMLVGLDREYGGTIRLGSGVSVGYFAQDTETMLEGSNTVLEELSTVATTADEPRLRNCLGSFLFSGDDVNKRVSVLSGGERSRLALLKILLHPVNLLVLDEPTNHLDINAKQMLADALRAYDGTAIFVSHDTYFISRLSNRILYLVRGERPEFFEGDWDYFSRKLKEKEQYKEEEKRTEKREEKKGALERREANRRRNRIISLTRQCELLSSEEEEQDGIIVLLERRMEDPEVWGNAVKAREVLERKREAEEARKRAEDEWFVLSEELEALKEGRP